MKNLHKEIQGMTAINLAWSYLRSRLLLLVLAFICAAFGFVCLGALIVQSGRSNLVPYLVTVDKQGVVLNQGTLSPHPEVPQAAVASVLCRFVQDVRMISSDAALQTEAITAAYSHILEGSQAKTELDSYYRSINPFELGQREQVNITISNVIAQTGSTYQIDWLERRVGKNNRSERSMRALISYELGPVDGLNAQGLLLNPLGIYVKDFVVSEVIA